MAKSSEMNLMWNFAGKVNPNLIKSAQSVAKNINDIKKAGAGTSKVFSSITSKIGSLTKYLSFGVLAGGAPSLMMIAKNTANAADEFKKFSERTGISAKVLSQWTHAANMNGLSNQEFSQSVEYMNKMISDAAQGSQQAMIAFQRAGVNIRDASGQLKTADQVMMEASDTFAKMPEGIYKSSLAMAMFGKSGSRMVALLQNGSASIQDFMKEADKIGVTFSDEDAAAAAEFNDNLDLLKKSVQGVSYSIGKQLYPLISPLIKSFSEWVSTNRELISSKVAEWIGKIKDNLPTIKRMVIDAYTAISTMAKSVNNIAQAMGGWETVLKYLVGAFVSIKGIQLASWMFGAGKAVAMFGKSLLTIIPVLIKFGVALLANPIGLVVAGIAALIVAGYALYKNWDTVVAWVEDLWGSVKNFFSSTFSDITSAFDKGFLSGLIEIVKKFNPVSLIANAINLVFKYFTGIDLIDAGKAFIQSFVNGFMSKWNGLKKSITSAFDKGFVSGVLNIIKNFNPLTLITKAINSIFKYFTGIDLIVVGKRFIQSFSDGLVNRWNSLKTFVSNLFVKWIPGVIKSMISIFSGGLSLLLGIVSKSWTSIVDSIESIWGGVTGFFSTSFGEITSAFDEGFLSGLIAIVKKFNPVSIIASAIESVFKYFTGISLSDSGGKFIQSFGDGILNTWNSIKSGIIDTVTGWVPDWVKSGASSIGSSLSSTFSNFPGYAAGGLITHHQIAQLGEDGQEMVIPLTKPNGPNLLMTAANMMGMIKDKPTNGNSGREIVRELAGTVVNNHKNSSISNPTFSPVINISTTSSATSESIANTVKTTLAKEMRSFEMMLERIQYNRVRKGVF